MKKDYTILYQALDYRFVDESLITLALTHRSYASKSNERLEFLGDSILGYVIAEALFEKHPEAPEGDLSRLRSQLVSGRSIAVMAKELRMNEFVFLGDGEKNSGGQDRASILANIFEAIIAAISLDADFEQAKLSVLRWYESKLETIELDKIAKDAKSCLQEWLQANHIELPVYKIVKTEGQAHEQMFLVSCEVASKDICIQAQGESRQKAEQKAAADVLALLKEKEK